MGLISELTGKLCGIIAQTTPEPLPNRIKWR